MPNKRIAELVQEAKSVVENLSVAQVKAALEDRDVLLVDIRELQERVDLGTIPSAKHAPRGMLEFWADPTSPYHRNWFAQHRRTILFCAGGARSALAAKALGELGFTNVAHLEPGFKGWQQAGEAVESVRATSRWVRR